MAAQEAEGCVALVLCDLCPHADLTPAVDDAVEPLLEFVGHHAYLR